MPADLRSLPVRSGGGLSCSGGQASLAAAQASAAKARGAVGDAVDKANTDYARREAFAAFAHTLGFQPLPAGFFAALVAMVVAYLVLVEFGKRLFYAATVTEPAIPHGFPVRRRHLRRRAAQFSVDGGSTRNP